MYSIHSAYVYIDVKLSLKSIIIFKMSPKKKEEKI